MLNQDVHFLNKLLTDKQLGAQKEPKRAQEILLGLGPEFVPLLLLDFERFEILSIKQNAHKFLIYGRFDMLKLVGVEMEGVEPYLQPAHFQTFKIPYSSQSLIRPSGSDAKSAGNKKPAN